MRYIFKVRLNELKTLMGGRKDAEFMASIDMEASTLSRIRSGKAYPSRDFIANIEGHYGTAQRERLFYLAPAVTRIKEKKEG